MTRPLLMNVPTPEDYEPGCPFKNLFLFSREWVSETAGNFSLLVSNGGSVAVDSNGWQLTVPGQRAGTVMMREVKVQDVDAAGLYPPGNYVMRYTGEGRIVLGMDAVPQEKESNGLWAKPQSPGRILFQVPQATGAGIYLGIEEENPSNRVRGIEICLSEYEGTLAANPWNPDALADNSLFSHQRLMNWGRINQHPNGTWANRATLSFARYTTRLGMPLELQIDWAKRLNQHLWINIPHKANDAYVEAMADLVHQLLPSWLDVWVEYSNEVWNTQFDANTQGFAGWDPSDGQGAYCEAQGLAAGLGPNPYQARLEFYSRRARQTINLFRSRFANPARVKRVLAGQHEGDPSNCNKIVDFENAYQSADVWSTAPYWGNAATGALANAQNMINNMAEQLAGAPTARLTEQKARAASRGLRYDLYEGGSGVIPANQGQVPIAHSALTDPQMRDQYKAFFDACIAAGVDLPGVYSYCTKWGTNGCFGHLRRVGESPRPPRWVALEEYVSQSVLQPAVPVSQARVEAFVGFDGQRYSWFAGPQTKAAFSGNAINFLGPTYQTQTLTADTQFTVQNQIRGARLVLELQGDFQVWWPTGFRVRSGRYDGREGRINLVGIYCVEHTGTPQFDVTIETLPAAQSGLLLRQALVTGDASTLFGSWAEILSSPSANPASATKYSRLGQIERFRKQNGFLELGVRYPQSNGSNGQPQFIEWRQMSSPLEWNARERVLGYQILAHNLINPNPYGGLCRTSINEAWLSYAPGSILSIVPFVGMSRHGLGPFLAAGNTLIMTPNQVPTSQIELYSL